MTAATHTLTDIFRAVQKNSKSVGLLGEEKVNSILLAVATAITANTELLISENEKDMAKMPATDPKYDRLKLTPKRLEDIAGEMRNVANLPSPLGRVLEERTMPNGMHISKITVPLGVIGIIYEARPNVTVDVFSLCLKAGNACILKGGSDAEHSNKAIVQLIRAVLKEHAVPETCIELLPATREATAELLNAVGYVDVIIPRGSQRLIDFVRTEARVPVIETGAGIVHAYFDKSGDVIKGKAIVFNAKTRRVSVCNALDCLVIHQDRIPELGELVQGMETQNVLIYADEPAFEILSTIYPANLLAKATAAHYGTEFLDYKMSVKTVTDLEAALEHIGTYSSKHSETIIAEDHTVIENFIKDVDAAVVYANVSTAFTDGAQFGLGAEIGISTQKIHARGPMALNEICSYKWIVRGDGQVRK